MLNGRLGLAGDQPGEDRRRFLMNMTCFATCIEGLFFFGAFAYVYFLRSKGLLSGLATGTNWVFRDESMHIAFANEVIATARREEPTLMNEQMNEMIVQMMEDAIDCEMGFANDILEHGVEWDESDADAEIGWLAAAPLASCCQAWRH